MSTGLDNLEIYKLAEKLEIFVYKLTKIFPDDEKYRAVDQLNRSSSAVSNNIAEGYGRYSFQDKINKFYIARGEAEETRKGINKSQKKGFISMKEADLCDKNYTQLIKQINAYINFLRRQQNPNPQVPKYPSTQSFTLIELMVSLGISVMVILAAMGIYLRVIGTREQSLGDLNIQEEGQYIMGLIVKDIRAGQIDYDSYGIGITKDCGIINEGDKVGDDGSTVAKLCLLDIDATPIRYKKCLDPNDATRSELKKCKDDNCEHDDCPASGDDYKIMTMRNISLERLDFYINPISDPFTAGSESYNHPYVTVVLGLKSLVESSTTAEIVLQQTVSQRYVKRK